MCVGWLGECLHGRLGWMLASRLNYDRRARAGGVGVGRGLGAKLFGGLGFGVRCNDALNIGGFNGIMTVVY